MPKLLVHGGGNWEIALKPGQNRLGRSSQNDGQIDHPSISSFHCIAEVLGDELYVEDLGSTNGTFIDSILISQGTLKAGQILQLGEVKLTFVNESCIEPVTQIASGDVRSNPRIRIAPSASQAPQPANIPIPPALNKPQSGPDDCVNHIGVPFAFVCQRCSRHYCRHCVKTHGSGTAKLHLCPSCNTLCASRSDQDKKEARRALTFGQALSQAWSYPFRGNGSFMLLGATILFSCVTAMSSVPIAGLAGAILSMLISGYLAAFMQGIIRSSAQGDESLPDWPDLSDVVQDIIYPFLQVMITVLICTMPGTLLMRHGSLPVGAILLALGLFVLPMALLTVSMAESIIGLNPLVIFPSILKIFGHYLVAFGVLLALFGIQTLLEMSTKYVKYPLLVVPIMMFAGLYGMVVEMRIVGMLYYTNEQRLGWFK